MLTSCWFSFFSQINQEKKLMHNLRQYQVPLQKYMALTELQVVILLQVSSDFLMCSKCQLCSTLKQGCRWSFSLLWLTGEEWEAVLQTSHWQCRGIAPDCIYSNCWWGLPEIWKHLQTPSGSLHKSEREVWVYVYFIPVIFQFSQNKVLITWTSFNLQR